MVWYAFKMHPKADIATHHDRNVAETCGGNINSQLTFVTTYKTFSILL